VYKSSDITHDVVRVNDPFAEQILYTNIQQNYNQFRLVQ